MSNKVLIIAAHIGDFVWRCGGAIAKHTTDGDDVKLIVLTFGARGESNNYWKQPNANMEECKTIRCSEGKNAAEILGISEVVIEDYTDYPIILNKERIEKLATLIRKYNPNIIYTHDNMCDPYNNDHTLVGEKVYEAISIAAAYGVSLSDLPPIKRPTVYGFEPHVAEISEFYPNVFVDITNVEQIKEKAMEAYKTQSQMLPNYINRGILRANQSKIAGCKFAEAFSKKL